jgi:hypothetical protein
MTRQLSHGWRYVAGFLPRQALALGLFARTEVIGLEQMIYELTPHAIALGLNAALPPVYELRASIAGYGRGERFQNIDFVLMG